MEPARRKDDKATWQKVAHNLVLVGSALAAVVVGFRFVGRYYLEQQTIESNTKNIKIIEQRLREAESKIDRRRFEIDNNTEEIKSLRQRVREIEKKR